LRGNSENNNGDSWWERVKENARAFFALRHGPMAAGGAKAFHLLEEKRPPNIAEKQIGSFALHLLVIGMLLWVWLPAVPKLKTPILPISVDGILYTPAKALAPAATPNRGQGSGGDISLLPPSAGDLARRSAVVMLHPRLPEQQEHVVLPVEPTLFGDEELRK